MEYSWSDKSGEELQSVVNINIDGVDWKVNWDVWCEAEREGRTNAITIGDRLILVDRETLLELKKLKKWLDDSKLGRDTN